MWAKTDNINESGLYHPLLYHLLDVAGVAGCLWDDCIGYALRCQLGACLGENARPLLVFFAGTHDIGKASPGFQKKRTSLAQCSGLSIPSNCLDQPHGYITAKVLPQFLKNGPAVRVLSRISGGHHGVFPRSENLSSMGVDSLGNRDWHQAREELLRQFARTVGIDLSSFKDNREIEEALLLPVVAGFITVADWIGSNQEFFPCEAEVGMPLPYSQEAYWQLAQQRAKHALQALGWLPAVTFACEKPFETVFDGLTANSLQSTVISMVSKQTTPYMLIVEAPMGKGKTEAALYAADLALSRGYAHGLYIAMPTQATGNAMYQRFLDDYLRHRGHEGKLNLQLVHGDALLAQDNHVAEGEVAEFKPAHIDDSHQTDVEAQSWFTAKKRPLLAPFGVGTIDQSLLSVLQTKHWFVRLFGLAGKVVICDEIHAYDSYMSTILERLLHWLAEAHCTVILLSATLPEFKRRAFVKAYSGHEDSESKAYPRVTLAHPRKYPLGKAETVSICEAISPDESRKVSLSFTGTDLEDIKTLLEEQLCDGGCAAVICNTVNRAMEVYSFLRNSLKNSECLLFHARMLKSQRREREAAVLKKFGKGKKDQDDFYNNTQRPIKAVLVSTQIIEQSLDLDFDFMVTEIAPIDLLLQRMGRLHRHQRRRPPSLQKPVLTVLCDGDREGPPPESFGKSLEYIYSRYILLRTWHAIRMRDCICVPDHLEALVEAVYNPDEESPEGGWETALLKARESLEYDQDKAKTIADTRLIDAPNDPGELLEVFNKKLEDDDHPLIHQQLRAATRLGDPSITVVFLPENSDLTLHSTATVRAFLDQSARLSHRQLFDVLCSEGIQPVEWEKNAHLRHARLLQLDGKRQGRIAEYIVTVDEQLGIVIEKDDANGK